MCLGALKLEEFAVAGETGPAELVKAPNGARLAAFAIDNVVCSGAISLMTAIFAQGFHFDHWIHVFLLSGVVNMMYTVLPVYVTGQTLGKKLMKIQVVCVDAGTGGELTLRQAMNREWVWKVISGFCLALGYLAILHHPEGRASHPRGQRSGRLGAISSFINSGIESASIFQIAVFINEF